jgi:thiamine-phosphate pyrophosphorylase
MKLRGFYAILDRDDPALAEQLAAHACALQIRIKTAGAAEIARVARMAQPICARAGIPLIINDRLDVALAVRADGVHLGQTDVALAEARRISGSLVIGVSTHNTPQVREAVAGGADYLGFGPVFATTTKENPDPVQGLAGLAAAVAAAPGVTIVAIGGIELPFARDIYAAGASCVCAISAVNKAADVGVAARQLQPPG